MTYGQACWPDVMTQMVTVLIPMLHLNDGSRLGTVVEASGAKVSFRLSAALGFWPNECLP